MNLKSSGGYQEALDLLKQCITDTGFQASPLEKTNYKRIWARDGIIIGLAAILSENSELILALKNTLTTLGEYQGPHGEIPSNVDTGQNRISYGGMTGRVDANLWFLIGCFAYWSISGDDHFLEGMMPRMERVRFLLECWEFNNRGFLYVPETGDWADEYIHNGYILYDQLLYLEAKKSLSAIKTYLSGKKDSALDESIFRLQKMIVSNYWFPAGEQAMASAKNKYIYHSILFNKGEKASKDRRGHYWMPFFSPHGYGYRFDSFANVLASLLGVASGKQSESVDNYIAKNIVHKKVRLLPAFAPVIKPVDKDWKDLKMTFSYTFKNKPYEYHNGGLWPMITAFYVADLSARGKTKEAEKYYHGIAMANHGGSSTAGWVFPEYLHGQTLKPGGTAKQGWSAAATVIAYHTLHGKKLFPGGNSNER